MKNIKEIKGSRVEGDYVIINCNKYLITEDVNYLAGAAEVISFITIAGINYKLD